MKRKAIAIMLVFLMATTILSNAAGTLRHSFAADVVWTPIGSAAELAQIRFGLAGHYRLTQDIDLAGYNAGDGRGWVPIGGNGSLFTGSFDGNGFVIRNMTINRPNDNNVGFFGETGNATITNVHLTNVNVKGHTYVGGLAGAPVTSTISRVSVQGTVSGEGGVGGLVGYNSLTNVSDSYAAGHIVAGSGDSFGGLIGYGTGNGARGSIARSYSTAAVDSGTNAGGLVGRVDGFVPATSAYWDTETSGQPASAAGTGKPTAQMLQKSTYSGWDFAGNGTDDPIWGMVEGATYPLHYGDYKKVALASLIVTDADGAAKALDRDFSGGYGSYSVRVGSETDQVKVSGTPLASGSIVSVEGGASTEALALIPGENTFKVKVSDAGDPAALNAVYKLTVYREDGSVQYPHRITTAEQLSSIGDSSVGYELDDRYELEADLDLTAYSAAAGWEPIGSGTTPFAGVFEGNGHTIANVSVNRPTSDDQGLFGVTSGAAISNVSIVNAEVAGADRVGGLIGRAENTIVAGVSVQGSVSGSGDVGGLIGAADALTSVRESYAAAEVQAGNDGGGLIGSGAAAGSVTHAFWDNERSGQVSSSGGGTPHSTSEMMKKATYTDYPGSVWAFGSGKRWGIVEGTTYPMPYASLQGVSPTAIAVAAPGTTVTMTPSVFNASTGIYAIALAAPVAHAEFTVTPAAGQTVSIDGVNGNSRAVDLTLGDNPVEIVVTGGNGQVGVYRFVLAVPSPSAEVASVPPGGIYGIGDELNFTVAYGDAVDVDSGSPPALPIVLDGGVSKSASYSGMSGGDPRTLQFRYTVQEGDEAAAGIQLGSALVAASPSSVTALGSSVSLELATPLPDTSGIVIDGELPEIDLTPSTTAPSGGAVTIAVDTDGTGTGIAGVKWAAGNRSIAYFGGAGTVLSGGSFEAADNGTYTVYAIDEAGNEQIKTIDVTNIVTAKPTVLLDYNPKTAVRASVEVSVTTSANNAGAGNKIEALKWAAGSLEAADFDDPAVGTDVPSSGKFHVTANGTYTVYAVDTAGNERVEEIAIANIVSGAPSITLDYTPKTAVADGVDIAVTATVADNAAGNKIEALKWAAGSLDSADFGDPAVGADVPSSGTFHVTANGTYTVYAVDTAGNERVEEIAIANIVSGAPVLTLDYTPKTAVTDGVDIAVTATVADDAAGNKIEALKWAAGSLDAADFDDPAVGADVPSSGKFHVTANGIYTVYAVDTAGNERVEKIAIANIVSGAPVLTLDYTPKTAAADGVDIAVTATVAVDAAGNKIEALKWAAGALEAADFDDPAVGTDVLSSGTFHVTENGTYTVYAVDTAGNERVEEIAIANIVSGVPVLTLDYTPKTAVADGVDIAVTATVADDAAGNKIEALKWAAGALDAADFDDPAVGADVPSAGKFHVTANGIYTVYAVDTAGNERVEEIAIANIVSGAPVLTLDYTPKTAAADGVDIAVTATVADDAAGNKIEALRWAAGALEAADFGDPSVGTDVPSSGKFHVTANGTYTVYAVDSAGNRKVRSIGIDNIVDPPVPPAISTNPVLNQASFYIVPGREYTLTIDGLELFVPGDAIKQATTITLKKVTDETKSLLQPGQLILSDVYELLKDTPGKFDAPVRLRLNLKNHSWADDQNPALVYYDETSAKWATIGGKLSGNTLAGETDHFTMFAVMPVTDEPTSEQPIPVPSDISGHWAEKEIADAVAKGIVSGYPDGTLRPNLPVTRAEFALLLYRVLALPASRLTNFADKNDIPAWASDAVAAVAAAGIVSGYPDNSFRPGARLSRIETAALIARAARLPATNTQRTSFADDAAIAEWALPYINATYEAGLVQGQSLNRYNPLTPITRAEAVVLLARLVSLK
ncbi:S-layer homology domain-containing protein [Cohnella sp. GbtcB17]|uniref:S-layer homology domain-containing protein n=1 Tax=Cohnella sp. GbtcB17 TaxID=2824762 RepID=UPI001C2F28DA|nr:S-layer homology domain-containing protein [Cohnella sp. GbtcB17]